MSDEHDVFVPRHELPLSGGAPHNHALHAVLNLVVQESVVAVEVELAAARGSGRDGREDGVRDGARARERERESCGVDGGPRYRAPKAEAGARARAKVAKVAS